MLTMVSMLVWLALTALMFASLSATAIICVILLAILFKSTISLGNKLATLFMFSTKLPI